MASLFRQSIFWISRYPPPSLAIVLCPQGGRQLRDDLLAIRRGGIQTLVSLLEEEEAHGYDLAKEGQLAGQLGLQFLAHPLPDHSTPPDRGAFRAFVSGLADRLRTGEQIGVHCLGSVGRSTVTAACALIELGWEPAAALAAIESARGRPVPDTEEQRRWILGYRARPER
jgi:protein-tyrosine phosphatase